MHIIRTALSGSNNVGERRLRPEPYLAVRSMAGQAKAEHAGTLRNDKGRTRGAAGDAEEPGAATSTAAPCSDLIEPGVADATGAITQLPPPLRAGIPHLLISK